LPTQASGPLRVGEKRRPALSKTSRRAAEALGEEEGAAVPTVKDKGPRITRIPANVLRAMRCQRPSFKAQSAVPEKGRLRRRHLTTKEEDTKSKSKGEGQLAERTQDSGAKRRLTH